MLSVEQKTNVARGRGNSIGLLDDLGYTTSPNFHTGARMAAAPNFGHIFRRASEAPCGLQGVYTLQPPENLQSLIPVLYVCEAASDADADEVHRLVWNQDVVPFLLVRTPASLSLYSGFRHRRSPSGSLDGRLLLKELNDVSEIVDGFHADAIDSGLVWRRWGAKVTPQYRVDRELLDNLRKLDGWLLSNGLDRDSSHALIGKYVYLSYLRHRDILSDRKFDGWGLSKDEVFGRNATLDGLSAVVARLDDWLNGELFPIDFDGAHAPKQSHITRVAATFAGDELVGEGDWQLWFDFKRYDFSFIPIETLSAIYEQFLHTPAADDRPSRGRALGAYYTPIPVVNLMLSELEDRRPLESGMRILDPSCGSGAFLVQCYRRLIEKCFPPSAKRPRPIELRKLLEDHIFGIDCDIDACNVSELSLTLTLLDYVHPPDLENDRRVKLPALRGRNIFCENFFDLPNSVQTRLEKQKFDWVVGNPPWKKLNPDKLLGVDRPAWKWMQKNKVGRPVGGNQIARAFAWKAAEFASDKGEIALFLPAMTLFEDPSRPFRSAFFDRMKVHAVANLSNLAEVLSGRRFRVPAAAFFYRPRRGHRADPRDEDITLYSPLVANQEPTRPVIEGSRQESWSIVINASEVRRVSLAQAADGDGIPWKLAAWGSYLDRKLLQKVSRSAPSLGDLESSGRLLVSEGLQLRVKPTRSDSEEVERVDEVVDKPLLNPAVLARLRYIFRFPPEATKAVPDERAYVRAGRAELPLSVCRPPHIIVSAARNFAVYTDEYLIVPPRQIGIVSPSGDESFLKALSLYLSSDFAFYHQFMTSAQFCIKRPVATLRALRTIPVPLANLKRTELGEWTSLHSRLVKTEPSRVTPATGRLDLGWDAADRQSAEPLLAELNDMVSDCLQLNHRERALVRDLVHCRLHLIDGKVGKPAVRSPNVAEMRSYARQLRSELDSFVRGTLKKRHQVSVLYDKLSAMIQINLGRASNGASEPTIERADRSVSSEMVRTRDRLRREKSQWVYFDRNLRIYDGRRTYILKPMQRFHWTQTQAMIDASEIIAETIGGSEGDA